MKSFPGRLVIVLSLLVFAVGACATKASSPAAAPLSESGAGSASAETSGGTITVGGKTANYRGTADLADSKDLELELKAENYAYTPTVIEGTPGLKGVVGIHNESDTLHNFSIDGVNIDKDIPPGGEQEILVTFPKSGALVFYCKYHQSSGMRGVLDTTGGKAIDMSGATGTSASTSTGQTDAGDQASPSSDSGGNRGY